MPPAINAAIIGYGKSGRNFHAPLLGACPGISLKAVVKRSGPGRLSDRPEVRVCRDLKTLFENEDISLAIITTPNHLHYTFALEALHAGKHVVIDKPFTVTAAEAAELIDLARKRGRVLSVFQNRRWDGDFLTVKKLLDGRATGRIVSFESSFNRFRKELREDAWKEQDLPGSGILYDLGPHLIDQALQLFGPPDSIYADVLAQRGGEADDYFAIDLHYEGFSARLSAGMLVLDDTPRFVLRGDEGAWIQYGMDPQEQALAEGGNPGSPDWGMDDENRYGTLLRWESGNKTGTKIRTEPGDYPGFYRNIADTINKGTELLVKPEEAMEVIRLIVLAKESSRLKKVLSATP